MTVNMGPQHPSTHGVLNLVVQLSGETIIKADATIGFLHTGIEKTAEQKKWQQVIPLVERMDYLGAQSNSLAFCLSVERLLGVDDQMPARVKDIRILIAELQRISSHLVSLGTHALEVGAVSVLMYCLTDRERLLNINEMLAGFRMFPSYIRVGGLREDLPPGFHEAVTAFLDDVPEEGGRVRRAAHQEPDLDEADAGRRRAVARGSHPVRPGRADGARHRHPLRRPQDVPVHRLRDLRLQRPDRDARATSTIATWSASPRCARA